MPQKFGKKSLANRLYKIHKNIHLANSFTATPEETKNVFTKN